MSARGAEGARAAACPLRAHPSPPPHPPPDRLGWCIWVFTLAAGAMLLVLSTKLVSVVRFATRFGAPHPLDPAPFWFRRPWLALPPVKLLLFFVSLVWSNAIFFAAAFGPHSCFFSRTGFQGAPVSWWGVVLVSVIYFFVLALNTMPLYALTGETRRGREMEGEGGRRGERGAHGAGSRPTPLLSSLLLQCKWGVTTSPTSWSRTRCAPISRRQRRRG